MAKVSELVNNYHAIANDSWFFWPDDVKNLINQVTRIRSSALDFRHFWSWMYCPKSSFAFKRYQTIYYILWRLLSQETLSISSKILWTMSIAFWLRVTNYRSPKNDLLFLGICNFQWSIIQIWYTVSNKNTHLADFETCVFRGYIRNQLSYKKVFNIYLHRCLKSFQMKNEIRS